MIHHNPVLAEKSKTEKKIPQIVFSPLSGDLISNRIEDNVYKKQLEYV